MEKLQSMMDFTEIYKIEINKSVNKCKKILVFVIQALNQIRLIRVLGVFF